MGTVALSYASVLVILMTKTAKAAKNVPTVMYEAPTATVAQGGKPPRSKALIGSMRNTAETAYVSVALWIVAASGRDDLFCRPTLYWCR